ncbi:DUF3667 domain-containing protein [Massilia sp. Se16.2.3]|uniref:DUF3667 domain-containing protein n=1 Tax=Massilia sp. Se16.2.3 TaxID=2709303 RepID=UPI0015FECF26|nr:DUF3667 domain-containing protein [Massilia sp. Se16.2.3]QNA97850.1 DUF3667 domain-containing protein [Massilia sp. Se16.2.3]
MNTDTDPHRAPGFCPNCDSPLGGNFCQTCGQPARLHVPSAREFLHEFIAHYVALEGKLWKSLGMLLFKPGRLTREYIEGRRVPYVEPLRLYLSFSIIFFAIYKFGDYRWRSSTAPRARRRRRAEAAAQGKPPVEAPRAAAAPADPAVTTADGRNEVLDEVDKLNPTLGSKLRQFMALPRTDKDAAVRKAFFSYTPYAIFALMPLFAAYLKLLYLGSGRRYGEHLLFALHTNAFAFLALSLLLILPSGIPLVGTALTLWLMFYTPTAMRRVYGGGRLMTGLRWIALMTLHFFSMVLAVVAVTALGALA